MARELEILLRKRIAKIQTGPFKSQPWSQATLKAFRQVLRDIRRIGRGW